MYKLAYWAVIHFSLAVAYSCFCSKEAAPVFPLLYRHSFGVQTRSEQPLLCAFCSTSSKFDENVLGLGFSFLVQKSIKKQFISYYAGLVLTF